MRVMPASPCKILPLSFGPLFDRMQSWKNRVLYTAGQCWPLLGLCYHVTQEWLAHGLSFAFTICFPTWFIADALSVANICRRSFRDLRAPEIERSALRYVHLTQDGRYSAHGISLLAFSSVHDGSTAGHHAWARIPMIRPDMVPRPAKTIPAGLDTDTVLVV